MTIQDAIATLDSVIPHPSNKMVDGEHAAIANAWQLIRAEITKNCEDCEMYESSSYEFYTYTCLECKRRTGDKFERRA